ncbi:MAG: glycoside hydrolase family 3 C-terminal domain-containing protein, partial [Propionibacteriaceae bacterium]|nr:glycoside hydrolase family 3 C-terminal domain-containing protein [Propionibacteriaceae bacterium]
MSLTNSDGSVKAKELRPLGKTAIIVRYVGAVIIAVALIVGNVYTSRYSNLISVFFGSATQRVIPGDDSPADYYISSFTDEASRQAYLAQVATDIEREGITLLENNGVLPLRAGARISVIGQDCVDPVYGGSGAGSISTTEVVTLGQAFAAAGLEVNPVAWSFYESGAGSSYRKTVKDVYGAGEYTVNEVPRSVYTDDVIASFADYADAAIVFIGRAGGETADLTHTPGANGYAYLQLDDDERDMLALAAEHFDKVIVLLNTDNAVELGVLEDFDIDAVAWVGAFGQTGATAVGEFLVGTINPSGALVDTYAYDSLGSPAMANFGGRYMIANSQVQQGNTYMAYAEGMYVGYRYYETRYEDVVLGNEPAARYNYATTVQYPFGYGLSYTDFAWSGFEVSENNTAYQVKVQVQNIGEVAGKDIVQVYLQQPYTDYDRSNGIEKPAVELVGYAKTALLAPGASETLSVNVAKEFLRVYDAYGYGTYIVEPGDYYLAVGDNAHDTLNNILASKGYTGTAGMDATGDASEVHKITIGSLDTTTYAVSQATGAAISNQFTDADLRNYDTSFSYMSRSDWSKWPATYADGSWSAPADFVAALELSVPTDPDAVLPEYSKVDENLGKLTAAMLRDVDYDDELWDILLNQASLEEVDSLVRVGGYATVGIDSIQLPATVDKDGPAGISGTLVGGDSGMGFPPAVVLASTWNDALSEEM